METEFITEKEKFKNWNGEFKICSMCKRNLPKSGYYFRLSKHRFHSECKECNGRKFRWGDRDKRVLIENGYKYCVECDTVYPLNAMYFNDKKEWRCRKCRSGVDFNTKFNIDRIVKAKSNYKICFQCLIELPLNDIYFYGQAQKLDDYAPACKKCNGREYEVKGLNKVFKDAIPNGHKFCPSCKRLLEIYEFPKNNIYCKLCTKIKKQFRRNGYKENNYTLNNWLESIEFWTVENNLYCAYCEKIITKPDMEHIIPISKGGKSIMENIIPACKYCNGSKHTMSIDEFYNKSENFTKEKYDKILEYINLYTERNEI